MNIVSDGKTDTEASNMNGATEGDAEMAEDASDPEEVDLSQPDSTAEDISSIEDEILKNYQNNSTPILEIKKVLSVLLIGSDTRSTRERGRSDSMILISINQETKTITATSLLRDIYLEIEGKQNNRLNAAYSFGGANLLMDTIENNFKIKIDRYASVDFNAFIDIIDAVGGVTIDVSDKELPVANDYIKSMSIARKEDANSDQLTHSGSQLLNGKQTLGYSRIRYVGNNDFERTARQRRVLEQVFQKVKGLNLVQINDLLNSILPQVTTNLTEGEIFGQILSLPSYTKYDFEQWSIPMTGTYKGMRIRGMEVLGIDFNKNIAELQHRIYASN